MNKLNAMESVYILGIAEEGFFDKFKKKPTENKPENKAAVRAMIHDPKDPVLMGMKYIDAYHDYTDVHGYGMDSVNMCFRMFYHHLTDYLETAYNHKDTKDYMRSVTYYNDSNLRVVEGHVGIFAYVEHHEPTLLSGSMKCSEEEFAKLRKSPDYKKGKKIVRENAEKIAKMYALLIRNTDIPSKIECTTFVAIHPALKKK